MATASEQDNSESRRADDQSARVPSASKDFTGSAGAPLSSKDFTGKQVTSAQNVKPSTRTWWPFSSSSNGSGPRTLLKVPANSSKDVFSSGAHKLQALESIEMKELDTKNSSFSALKITEKASNITSETSDNQEFPVSETKDTPHSSRNESNPHTTSSDESDKLWASPNLDKPIDGQLIEVKLASKDRRREIAEVMAKATPSAAIDESNVEGDAGATPSPSVGCCAQLPSHLNVNVGKPAQNTVNQPFSSGLSPMKKPMIESEDKRIPPSADYASDIINSLSSGSPKNGLDIFRVEGSFISNQPAFLDVPTSQAHLRTPKENALHILESLEAPNSISHTTPRSSKQNTLRMLESNRLIATSNSVISTATFGRFEDFSASSCDDIASQCIPPPLFSNELLVGATRNQQENRHLSNVQNKLLSSQKEEDALREDEDSKLSSRKTTEDASSQSLRANSRARPDLMEATIESSTPKLHPLMQPSSSQTDEKFDADDYVSQKIAGIKVFNDFNARSENKLTPTEKSLSDSSFLQNRGSSSASTRKKLEEAVMKNEAITESVNNGGPAVRKGEDEDVSAVPMRLPSGENASYPISSFSNMIEFGETDRRLFSETLKSQLSMSTEELNNLADSTVTEPENAAGASGSTHHSRTSKRVLSESAKDSKTSSASLSVTSLSGRAQGGSPLEQSALKTRAESEPSSSDHEMWHPLKDGVSGAQSGGGSAAPAPFLGKKSTAIRVSKFPSPSLVTGGAAALKAEKEVLSVKGSKGSAASSKEFSNILESKKSGPQMPRKLQVVLDIDDTVMSSGGVKFFNVHLGGVDTQYSRGIIYPGAAQFIFELAMFGLPRNEKPLSAGVLTARIPQVPIKSDFPINKLLQATARRSGVSDWGIDVQKKVMYSTINEWVNFYAKADKKFENFQLLHRLVTESEKMNVKYVWIGDTGEMDLVAGEMMANAMPQSLEAIFMHFVSEIDNPYLKIPGDYEVKGVPIFYFKTYVSAARKAYQCGLLSKGGALRTALQTILDLDVYNVSAYSSKWIDIIKDLNDAESVFEMRKSTVKQVIHAVNIVKSKSTEIRARIAASHAKKRADAEKSKTA